MKRDSIIKMKELLNFNLEITNLVDELKSEKPCVSNNELNKIAKKCLKAYEYAIKLKYQK